ncbi:MAG: hypothetical protein CMK95_07420 [Pseudomonas sp.]|nr:hypothetical protein [Pseudomonas sp.]HBM10113.1 hypothetical protein [Pseudomonas sp.]
MLMLDTLIDLMKAPSPNVTASQTLVMVIPPSFPPIKQGMAISLTRMPMHSSTPALLAVLLQGG